MPEQNKTENTEGTKVEKTTTDNDTKQESTQLTDEVLKNFKIEEGKSYTAKEAMEILNNGIKHGHVIAKNQLNKDITKLKSEVSTLKGDKDTLENKLKELDSTKQTTQAEQEKNQSEKTEIQRQLEETNAKLKVMEEAAVKAVDRVSQLEIENKTEKLNTEKQRLIADAKGRIIVSSVRGNTIEELQESAKNAMKEYEDVEAEMRKKFNVPEKTKEGDDTNKKEIVVKRIDPKNPDDVRDYKKRSEDIKLQIYRNAGFPV